MEPYELTDEAFERFRSLVYSRTGISLASTKRQLLHSRLQRRIRALHLNGFDDYYQHLLKVSDKDPEAVEFINAVTTNKTDFFREPHHFQFATETVIPELIARGQSSLRVWHAGCSTGEEPYTLGMAFREAGLDQRIDIKQLASDIDTRVLEHAKTGIYAEDRVQTISETLLRKWFLRGKGTQAGSYRVRPELQTSITFRRINLIEQPWPIKSSVRFDIIFCRNVLIYFDRPTQEVLVRGFLERLQPGGYLFLGHSESLHSMLGEFTSLGHTIYRAERSIAYSRYAA